MALKLKHIDVGKMTKNEADATLKTVLKPEWPDGPEFREDDMDMVPVIPGIIILLGIIIALLLGIK